MDLHTIFNGLTEPSGLGIDTKFGAKSIPNYPHFYIAKDSHGLPSILISVKEHFENNKTPPITLEHVSVYFDVLCRITISNGATYEGVFTVIRCTGREKLLHTYFLRVIRILLDLLPEMPTKTEVAKAISTLVELFHAMASPPRKSIQGLWAELLLIETSLQPEVLVAAWHATPHDRYDFNAGDERIEVKSTSQRIRQHHFSLEQVTPIDGTRVLIASLFTEVVNNGVTVMRLADGVRAKIAAFPDLIAHLDEIVSTTLGVNWQTAFEDSFDKQLALSTLRFYDLSSIPSITSPIPTGVSEIHFKSDLTNCEPLTLSQLSKRGSLFSSLPKK